MKALLAGAALCAVFAYIERANVEIGLIDVDNLGKKTVKFPNLAIMKISAWHKAQGDNVEWWSKTAEHYDKVYMSKVFSDAYSKPVNDPKNADIVEHGGTGYCISLIDGKEVFDQSKNNELPYEIEHIYPDYGLYGISDTAYGFMSRGCPRGCSFCHVKAKEGLRAHNLQRLLRHRNRAAKNVHTDYMNT